MNRYWYSGTIHHQFVCGWVFGDNEDEARAKARVEACRWKSYLTPYAADATIHLQFNQNVASGEPAVW